MILNGLAAAAAAAKSLESCPTLCKPIDSSPPGSAIPGILQARTLEWVAIRCSLLQLWAPLVAQSVKNLPTVWETYVQSLGPEYLL